MQRQTRQRDAVLQAIEGAGRALTPPEILALAQGAVARLNLSTIYRQLHALQGEARIAKVLLPGQPARFEAVCSGGREADHHHHHHHFHCERCDRVYPLHACPGPLQELAPAGFRVTAHEITLRGLCADCSTPGRARRRPAMTPFELPASGMALFFLLGLRHGIEPDHIAAIDGLTLRAHDHREAHAPWTGSLFALGHGLAIAAIAVAISALAASVRLPARLVQWIDWLPIVLLALLGVWNLRALLRPGRYQPSSVRMRLIPARLRERTDVWSTVAIGLLFALVIDTVAHVSAWSVFATHRGGWWAGVAAGLLFSLGMLIASTADSQIVARVLRSARSDAAASRLRRGIGWFVVLLSFGVVAQALATRL